MSEKSATTYTVLHLHFKLRVRPDAFLAKSREAATIIASVEGLIWKIWVSQEEEFEIGGMYLFANREAAEGYLNHPVIQAMRSNPAVVSTQSQLWVSPITGSSTHTQGNPNHNLLGLPGRVG